jgi:hypothetical protein
VLSGPTDRPGIPTYILVLLVGVIVVQGIAFFSPPFRWTAKSAASNKTVNQLGNRSKLA